jgi:hypothetical protein
MIDVTCQCGYVCHSEEKHVGKHLRCPNYGEPVPILDAPRAIAQPRAAPRPPHIKPRQPQAARLSDRSQLKYLVAAVLGMAALVIGLFFHFRIPVTTQTGAANVSDTDTHTAVQQQTGDSQRGSSPGLTVIGEEPLPTTDKQKQLADPRPTQYNSLPTGTRCEKDVGTDGHGKLTVENGTGEDAVVSLSEGDADANQALRCFFVQAHSSAHVGQIPEGVYALTFTTGLNWVESEGAFSWHPSYSEFEHSFEFREERDSEGVQYHSISVTLHSVPLGNVRTKTITREEFLKGHRRIALQR